MVELLRDDVWYRAQVVSITAVSASGTPCYKILFEPNDPAGLEHWPLHNWAYKLIPKRDAATYLRPYPGEAVEEAVGGGEADAQFKNSVNIRF